MSSLYRRNTIFNDDLCYGCKKCFFHVRFVSENLTHFNGCST